MRHRTPHHGFTLIELLVVISIIALLIAILLPALAAAHRAARTATCASRLHQFGVSIINYTADHDSFLPRGPETVNLMFGEPWDQMATNQTWIGTSAAWADAETRGNYNGIGVLLQAYLPEPRVMFCPDDNTADPIVELENLRAAGSNDAFSSYLYRHMDQITGQRIEKLGRNDAGQSARMLAMDLNSLGTMHPTLHRTNHEARLVNILYLDGHVVTEDNSDDLFSVDADSANGPMIGQPQKSVQRLDQIIVNADFAEMGDPAEAPQL